MSAVLDALSSPLRKYVAQILQSYLGKYINDTIQLEALGLGGDVILNSLDLNLAILQDLIPTPLTFEFTRGFVQELRIIIPWTALLSQPIKIQLTNVECILTARSKQGFRSHAVSVASAPDLAGAGEAPPSPATASSAGMPSWIQSRLTNILANITVEVNNLCFKYEHADVVCSVGVERVHLFSASPEWEPAFVEPAGPRKVLRKSCTVRGVSVSLDRRGESFQDPILRRMAVNLRAQIALEPAAPLEVPTRLGADRLPPRPGGGGAPSKPSTPTLSDDGGDPGVAAALTVAALPTAQGGGAGEAAEATAVFGDLLHHGAAMALVDVHVSALDVSVSDTQCAMLGRLTTLPDADEVWRGETPAGESKSKPPPVAPKLPSVPTTPLTPDKAESEPGGDGDGGWLSWAWGAVVGEEEEEEAAAAAAAAAAGGTPPAAHKDTVTVVNVHLEGASLTLTRRMERTEAGDDSPPETGVIQVPVHNVGFVAVPVAPAPAAAGSRSSWVSVPFVALHVDGVNAQARIHDTIGFCVGSRAPLQVVDAVVDVGYVGVEAPTGDGRITRLAACGRRGAPGGGCGAHPHAASCLFDLRFDGATDWWAPPPPGALVPAYHSGFGVFDVATADGTMPGAGTGTPALQLRVTTATPDPKDSTQRRIQALAGVGVLSTLAETDTGTDGTDASGDTGTDGTEDTGTETGTETEASDDDGEKGKEAQPSPPTCLTVRCHLAPVAARYDADVVGAVVDMVAAVRAPALVEGEEEEETASPRRTFKRRRRRLSTPVATKPVAPHGVKPAVDVVVHLPAAQLWCPVVDPAALPPPAPWEHAAWIKAEVCGVDVRVQKNLPYGMRSSVVTPSPPPLLPTPTTPGSDAAFVAGIDRFGGADSAAAVAVSQGLGVHVNRAGVTVMARPDDGPSFSTASVLAGVDGLWAAWAIEIVSAPDGMLPAATPPPPEDGPVVPARFPLLPSTSGEGHVSLRAGAASLLTTARLRDVQALAAAVAHVQGRSVAALPATRGPWVTVRAHSICAGVSCGATAQRRYGDGGASVDARVGGVVCEVDGAEEAVLAWPAAHTHAAHAAVFSARFRGLPASVARAGCQVLSGWTAFEGRSRPSRQSTTAHREPASSAQLLMDSARLSLHWTHMLHAVEVVVACGDALAALVPTPPPAPPDPAPASPTLRPASPAAAPPVLDAAPPRRASEITVLQTDISEWLWSLQAPPVADTEASRVPAVWVSATFAPWVVLLQPTPAAAFEASTPTLTLATTAATPGMHVVEEGEGAVVSPLAPAGMRVQSGVVLDVGVSGLGVVALTPGGDTPNAVRRMVDVGVKGRVVWKCQYTSPKRGHQRRARLWVGFQTSLAVAPAVVDVSVGQLDALSRLEVPWGGGGGGGPLPPPTTAAAPPPTAAASASAAAHLVSARLRSMYSLHLTYDVKVRCPQAVAVLRLRPSPTPCCVRAALHRVGACAVGASSPLPSVDACLSVGEVTVQEVHVTSAAAPVAAVLGSPNSRRATPLELTFPVVCTVPDGHSDVVVNPSLLVDASPAWLQVCVEGSQEPRAATLVVHPVDVIVNPALVGRLVGGLSPWLSAQATPPVHGPAPESAPTPAPVPAAVADLPNVNVDVGRLRLFLPDAPILPASANLGSVYPKPPLPPCVAAVLGGIRVTSAAAPPPTPASDGGAAAPAHTATLSLQGMALSTGSFVAEGSPSPPRGDVDGGGGPLDQVLARGKVWTGAFMLHPVHFEAEVGFEGDPDGTLLAAVLRATVSPVDVCASAQQCTHVARVVAAASGVFAALPASPQPAPPPAASPGTPLWLQATLTLHYARMVLLAPGGVPVLEAVVGGLSAEAHHGLGGATRGGAPPHGTITVEHVTCVAQDEGGGGRRPLLARLAGSQSTFLSGGWRQLDATLELAPFVLCVDADAVAQVVAVVGVATSLLPAGGAHPGHGALPPPPASTTPTPSPTPYSVKLVVSDVWVVAATRVGGPSAGLVLEQAFVLLCSKPGDDGVTVDASVSGITCVASPALGFALDGDTGFQTPPCLTSAASRPSPPACSVVLHPMLVRGSVALRRASTLVDVSVSDMAWSVGGTHVQVAAAVVRRITAAASGGDDTPGAQPPPPVPAAPPGPLPASPPEGFPLGSLRRVLGANSRPAPGELVIDDCAQWDDASEQWWASLTWRFPECRVVTGVAADGPVLLLPDTFTAAVGRLSTSPPQQARATGGVPAGLPCRLQRWDALLRRFVSVVGFDVVVQQWGGTGAHSGPRAGKATPPFVRNVKWFDAACAVLSGAGCLASTLSASSTAYSSGHPPLRVPFASHEWRLVWAHTCVHPPPAPAPLCHPAHMSISTALASCLTLDATCDARLSPSLQVSASIGTVSVALLHDCSESRALAAALRSGASVSTWSEEEVARLQVAATQAGVVVWPTAPPPAWMAAAGPRVALPTAAAHITSGVRVDVQSLRDMARLPLVSAPNIAATGVWCGEPTTAHLRAAVSGIDVDVHDVSVLGLHHAALALAADLAPGGTLGAAVEPGGDTSGACLRHDVINSTDQHVWFGQSGTSEALVLPPLGSMPYSWSPAEARVGGDRKLRFALSRGDGGGGQSPTVWSEPVCVTAAGVTRRLLFPDRHKGVVVAPLWVAVQLNGLQTVVTLHASHTLRNHTPIPLRARWWVSGGDRGGVAVAMDDDGGDEEHVGFFWARSTSTGQTRFKLPFGGGGGSRRRRPPHLGDDDGAVASPYKAGSGPPLSWEDAAAGRSPFCGSTELPCLPTEAGSAVDEPPGSRYVAFPAPARAQQAAVRCHLQFGVEGGTWTAPVTLPAGFDANGDGGAGAPAAAFLLQVDVGAHEPAWVWCVVRHVEVDMVGGREGAPASHLGSPLASPVSTGVEAPRGWVSVEVWPLVVFDNATSMPMALGVRRTEQWEAAPTDSTMWRHGRRFRVAVAEQRAGGPPDVSAPPRTAVACVNLSALAAHEVTVTRAGAAPVGVPSHTQLGALARQAGLLSGTGTSSPPSSPVGTPRPPESPADMFSPALLRTPGTDPHALAAAAVTTAAAQLEAMRRRAASDAGHGSPPRDLPRGGPPVSEGVLPALHLAVDLQSWLRNYGGMPLGAMFQARPSADGADAMPVFDGVVLSGGGTGVQHVAFPVTLSPPALHDLGASRRHLLPVAIALDGGGDRGVGGTSGAVLATTGLLAGGLPTLAVRLRPCFRLVSACAEALSVFCVAEPDVAEGADDLGEAGSPVVPQHTPASVTVDLQPGASHDLCVLGADGALCVKVAGGGGGGWSTPVFLRPGCSLRVHVPCPGSPLFTTPYLLCGSMAAHGEPLVVTVKPLGVFHNATGLPLAWQPAYPWYAFPSTKPNCESVFRVAANGGGLTGASTSVPVAIPVSNDAPAPFWSFAMGVVPPGGAAHVTSWSDVVVVEEAEGEGVSWVPMTVAAAWRSMTPPGVASSSTPSEAPQGWSASALRPSDGTVWQVVVPQTGGGVGDVLPPVLVSLSVVAVDGQVHVAAFLDPSPQVQVHNNTPLPLGLRVAAPTAPVVPLPPHSGMDVSWDAMPAFGTRVATSWVQSIPLSAPTGDVVPFPVTLGGGDGGDVMLPGAPTVVAARPQRVFPRDTPLVFPQVCLQVLRVEDDSGVAPPRQVPPDAGEPSEWCPPLTLAPGRHGASVLDASGAAHDLAVDVAVRGGVHVVCVGRGGGGGGDGAVVAPPTPRMHAKPSLARRSMRCEVDVGPVSVSVFRVGAAGGSRATWAPTDTPDVELLHAQIGGIGGVVCAYAAPERGEAVAAVPPGGTLAACDMGLGDQLDVALTLTSVNVDHHAPSPDDSRRMASMLACVPREGTDTAVRVSVSLCGAPWDAGRHVYVGGGRRAAMAPPPAALRDLDIGLAPAEVCIQDSTVFMLAEALSPLVVSLLAQQASMGVGGGVGGDVVGGGEVVVPGGEGCLPAPPAVPGRLPPPASALFNPRLCFGRLRVAPVSLLLTLHATRLVYVGVDRMPLSLSRVVLTHVRATPGRLSRDLIANFIADAVLESPALLGSLEVLGNPTGLVRSMSSGVYDLFALPVQSIRRGWGPRHVIRGVAAGWTSLLTHTVEGTVSSLSGLAVTLSRNLDRLSMDDAHVAAREAERQRASGQGLGGGLASGVKGLTAGVVGGAAGIVSAPLQSTQRRGWGLLNVVGGVGKGLLGAVTKPMSGAMDLVSGAALGLLETTGLHHGARALRRARVLELAVNQDLRVRWKVLPGVGCPPSSYVTRVEGRVVVSESTAGGLFGAEVPVCVVLVQDHVVVLAAGGAGPLMPPCVPESLREETAGVFGGRRDVSAVPIAAVTRVEEGHASRDVVVLRYEVGEDGFGLRLVLPLPARRVFSLALSRLRAGLLVSPSWCASQLGV